MVSLYVSSHYKNTPNDLLLMADAPSAELFVLLGPVDQSKVSERGMWLMVAVLVDNGLLLAWTGPLQGSP
jgi:tRNA(Met) C34 N-acetyltransferase TmcA